MISIPEVQTDKHYKIIEMQYIFSFWISFVKCERCDPFNRELLFLSNNTFLSLSSSVSQKPTLGTACEGSHRPHKRLVSLEKLVFVRSPAGPSQLSDRRLL